MVREYTLYGFSSFKFVKVCDMTQNKIFLNVTFALEKNKNFASQVVYKCQLGQLVDNMLFKSSIPLLIFCLLL